MKEAVLVGRTNLLIAIAKSGLMPNCQRVTVNFEKVSDLQLAIAVKARQQQYRLLADQKANVTSRTLRWLVAHSLNTPAARLRSKHTIYQVQSRNVVLNLIISNTSRLLGCLPCTASRYRSKGAAQTAPGCANHPDARLKAHP